MIPGIRYNGVMRKMSLWESLVGLFRFGRWQRETLEMSEPIFPGQPGYEDAPYETSYLWHRTSIKVNEASDEK